jgi:hypothetical protein
VTVGAEMSKIVTLVQGGTADNGTEGWVPSRYLAPIGCGHKADPTRARNGITQSAAMTSTSDPMLQKIVDAIEEIRTEEFDYEILMAASDVLGEDLTKTWKPSLSYLPPEHRDGEYHVTIYASGACETCPIKKSHVASIEPKVREIVGADNIYVHDYFDWFDTQFTLPSGD